MKVFREGKLKQFIARGKYKEAYYLLREVIIGYFEEKIKEKNPQYIYVDMIDMINEGNRNLPSNIKYLPKLIDTFSEEEVDYVNELDRLMDIYSIIKEDYIERKNQ